MSRIETIGNATLYLGDCRDILPGLSGVDAVVTDPPFGVRSEAWDSMSSQEFARFSMQWLALASKSAPELITFCTADSVIRDLCGMLYPRSRQMIWHKPSGSQYPGGRERTRWFGFETILHCFTPERWTVVEPKTLTIATMIREAREAIGISRGAVDIALRGKRTGLCFRWEEAACLPNDDQAHALITLLRMNQASFMAALSIAVMAREQTKALLLAAASAHAADKTDVLSYRTVTNGAHPCEKPINLMEDLLTSSGATYEVVVDPFMGSGTTGVACTNCGIQFIGIEADFSYFDIACQRIEAAQRQTNLFTQQTAAKPIKLTNDLFT